MEQKKFSKGFLNKGRGLRGLNELNLQETDTTANEAAVLKAYRIFLFSIL